MKKEVKKTSWAAGLGSYATVFSSIISLLFMLFFVGIIVVPMLLSRAETAGANVALIKLEGMIVTSAEGFDGNAVAEDIIELLDNAQQDEAMKAVVLEINSPGGTPVASEAIARKVRETDKPVIAVIKDMGTSGAYWVASAADMILASRLSVTGSIGVIGSYVDFSGLMTRYNVTYNRIVSGAYKDTGSPFKTLTADEKQLFGNMVSEMHRIFIDEVANNRQMSRENVSKLATGFVFLGDEAVRNGLIDRIGDVEDAYDILERELDIKVKPATFRKPPSFFEALMRAASEPAFYAGKGIGAALTEQSVRMPQFS